ncbi:MAG: type II toxin-antitoxin system HipA family toxin [Bacilli bacterium]|nr:type II toxin-antitoxin system HipA family toxin [Bacilli bacterium]
MKEINKLIVKYHRKTVGYLVKMKNDSICFQYDDEWIREGFSISPLSLPLNNKIYTAPNNNFDGMFGVFQDSLPDGWGELVLRRKLANNGINYDKLSPLQKLSLVTEIGLGALTYIPSSSPESKDITINLDKIAQEAQQLYDDNLTFSSLDDIYFLGGSSGGTHLKAHIVDENGDNWIVKFPCKNDPSNIGKIEYNINLLAKECGLNVNEPKLFKSSLCDGYFGSKRFDRNKKERYHMISLSSLLETSHRTPNLDYVILLQVINKICRNSDEVYEGFRRMCFNVFINNKDDHGKNFSFLYDEKRKTYSLSPAYDLTITKNKMEHEMSINGKGNPSKTDLLDVAKLMGLNNKRCIDIMNEIENVINIKQK